MEVLVAASSGAIAGLISGVIGSLVAPWVQWAIEKRRSRLRYRQGQIEIWRRRVREFNFRGDMKFTATGAYSEMRPHLRSEVRDALEKPRTAILANEARGEVAERYMLLDEITRIENEWGLV